MSIWNEIFVENASSYDFFRQVEDVLKDMKLRVSNYGEFLEISEIQSLCGPVLILFCDNEDLNIDSDGDGKPDKNVDTNNDGTADKNIVNIFCSKCGHKLKKSESDSKKEKDKKTE